MDEALDLIADGVRAERAGALDRALELYRSAASSSAEPQVQVRALTHEADVHRSRCDWDAAIAAARRAQDVAHEAGLTQLEAEAIVAEANVLMCRGDFAAALPRFDEVASGHSDPRLRGIALQNIGSMRAQSGQPRAAERAFAESLGNFQKAGYLRGEAIALNNLGRLRLESDDPGEARPLLEQALGHARDLEDHDLIALVSLNLAGALVQQPDLDRAQDLAMAALGYFSACQNRYRELECLRLMGDINVRSNDRENARRCYDSALALAREIGSEVEVRATQTRLERL